jgi:hypothetical protein
LTVDVSTVEIDAPDQQLVPPTSEPINNVFTEPPACPVCDGPMVIRTARRARRAGGMFEIPGVSGNRKSSCNDPGSAAVSEADEPLKGHNPLRPRFRSDSAGPPPVFRVLPQRVTHAPHIQHSQFPVDTKN